MLSLFSPSCSAKESEEIFNSRLADKSLVDRSPVPKTSPRKIDWGNLERKRREAIINIKNSKCAAHVEEAILKAHFPVVVSIRGECSDAEPFLTERYSKLGYHVSMRGLEYSGKYTIYDIDHLVISHPLKKINASMNEAKWVKVDSTHLVNNTYQVLNVSSHGKKEW